MEGGELGSLIILESFSGVKEGPLLRSVVLASELAEVRMALAWRVVSLEKKPEMGLTILLMGQGRSVLRDNRVYRERVPRSSAHSLWQVHCQLLETKAIF